MSRYSVADAKNGLGGLIDKTLAGEEVIITRHGKPVVELRVVNPPSKRPAGATAMDEWLRARRDQRPPMTITSVELLNEMYDSDD